MNNYVPPFVSFFENFSVYTILITFLHSISVSLYYSLSVFPSVSMSLSPPVFVSFPLSMYVQIFKGWHNISRSQFYLSLILSALSLCFFFCIFLSASLFVCASVSLFRCLSLSFYYTYTLCLVSCKLLTRLQQTLTKFSDLRKL